TLPQGIEAWNTKYDGQYALRPQTFALLQNLRRRKPEMHAFYGQDLHWKKQFRGIFVEVDCPAADSKSILKALAGGSYRGIKGELALPSSGILSDELLTEFGRANERSQRVSRFFKGGAKMLKSVGISAPQSLKTQLRRIF